MRSRCKAFVKSWLCTAPPWGKHPVQQSDLLLAGDSQGLCLVTKAWVSLQRQLTWTCFSLCCISEGSSFSPSLNARHSPSFDY